MEDWNEYCKFHNYFSDGFYGCVDKDGLWFDSAVTFDIAVHWCCMNYGMYDLSPSQEIEWMTTKGLELGISIIHSDQLKRMWKAGLIS